MSQEFLAILDYMEKEKGINREVLIESVENALLAAARKSLGPAGQDLRVSLDPKKGDIKAFAKLRVVDQISNPHDEVTLMQARRVKPNAKLMELVEMEVKPRNFGRIAAQVFKQAMAQTVRGIERDMIYEDFKDREGTIVIGTVRRFERSDVIVDLGRCEAKMPARERVPTEDYTPGERLSALLLVIDNTPRGPEIILSRSHPDFVRKLFQREVSELNDGTVEIKALAREAGYRTKLAVHSEHDKVDPVGACVGIRGARVKNIVRELNNEKVDLFRWSPDIRELVLEALKPAKLKNIEIDEEGHRVTAIVDEENLSLAIGRRGQNARLTQKLTGWEIDIKKEESEELTFEEKLQQAAATFTDELGISSEEATQIIQSGFATFDGIWAASEADFTEALVEGMGMDEARAKEIYAAASAKKPTENASA
ncbi:MAG: transcription termination factor NusA [Verrucomicrobiota bacterium]